MLWNTLSHPNVLKLIGVYGEMDRGEFITVSEWMVHGNIMDYIKKSYVNRLQLVRELILWLLSPLMGNHSCTGQLRA